ncbi:polysaccharide biosynthesis tyrosine autokinase [Aquamicrobium sp. LC103]|uniref:polysaccharide biosynthesis tyrosine autokinase n=1 Tax=Aquamicrobium sp. LC103 TaxID=1120658 RepID=UPI00063EC6A8|nr:polysaccharide biosynthesis tyrosine autokinase [Aquamicrobium sp. LC103]TKT69335.1 polysaccharide biosynthesis tyrosine autokinase [Aquamicrobium sp. LC103]
MTYASFPFDGKMPAQPPGERNDDLIDIERLLRMALRQAKVVIVCAVIGLLLGVVYLQTTPPKYTAVARVLIDEGLSRITEDAETTPLNMQSDGAVLSQIEILTSSRLAGNVVDHLRLTENENFMNPPSSLFGRIVGGLRGLVGYLRSQPEANDGDYDAETLAAMKAAATRQYAIELLQKNVVANRVGRTFVVAVAYQSHDPQLAAEITNAYADAYLSHQLDASYEASERATVWLRDRLDELRAGSQNAALEVEKYRAEHGLSASQGQLLTEQQLTELTGQLIEAQADTAKTQARYQQYKAIVDAGSAEAVGNVAITSDQPPTSTIATLKERYLNVTRREQEITRNYGEDHQQAVALRREQAELTRSIYAQLQQLTESYRNDFEVAQARETALRRTLSDARGESAEANQSRVVLRELEQQASALSALYQTFLSRYEETQQKQSFPIAKVRVISEATTPKAATSPRTSMVLGIALILGGMLGGALGALNEFNERFFRTGEDVRDQLGMKFLGYLPLIGRAEVKGKTPAAPGASPDSKKAERATALMERRARMRVTVDAPASMFAESLRNAKIAGDVVLQNSRSKVIGVVSVLPGEGKSTVASNLAELLALNNSRTLLIDADLRNPGLTRGLGIRSEAGLMEAVVNLQNWRSLLKHDRQTNLAILPAVVRGQFSHTSELLSSPGMHQLIEQARESFEHIIVDLPPLGPVVDAKAFEPCADGFVVVVEWGRTPRAVVRSTLASEPRIANKVLGVVLNKVKLASLPRYGSFGSSEQFLRRYSSYYLDNTETREKEPS